ncbi:MAG TPA: glycosyltransferase [Planctomycetota bacterium]|nr:glycosyltransferase [Phycisphaerae bacterium]HUW58048.1 glycosyltransferase [Planctomycetota bacterium]
MIEGRTILCFASGYDAPPTSKHHVMHLLAERNVVLWVNYHASRTPSVSSSDLFYVAQKLKQVVSGVSNPRKNVYVATPMVLPLPDCDWARNVNRRLLVSRLKRLVTRLGNGPLQIWSFTPDVAYLIDEFDAEAVVYYCVDDFAHFSGYDAEQVLRDEAALCRRADLVVTTSKALQEAKKSLNPNTIMVPHGVDYEHFARAADNNLPTPDDVADIPHPIFGFFGLIRDWIDLDLLAEVARRKPDWHFVLIGDSKVDLTPYRELPNMHFLGGRPYEQLPAYCKAFDAGLIPFKINDLTLAVNPIKLREYLAAGLPVISTPLREVEIYGGLVRMAGTPDEFITAAEVVLAEDYQKRLNRQRAMSKETWDHKVESISDSLGRVSGRRLPRPRQLHVHGRNGPVKIVVGYDGGGWKRQTVWLLEHCPSGVSVVLAATRYVYADLEKDEESSRRYLRIYRVDAQRQLGRHSFYESIKRLLSGMLSCARAVFKERPDGVAVVASSIAVPLLISAKWLGIKTVFIDSITRVTKPSRTGRIISFLGLADRLYVQWPEGTAMYRRAIYAGRLI